MRRFSAASVLAAISSLVALVFLSLLAACSGASTNSTPYVASITLTPSNAVSVNLGQVTTLTAVPKDGSGNTVVADVTFTSSNTGLVTVGPAGAVCGGTFDANLIVCTPAGVGQATITATSGTATATIPVYVHQQIDQIVTAPTTDCVSVGGTVTLTAKAFNTSNAGCSVAQPCDITSTVGPFTFNSADTTVISPFITTGSLVAVSTGLGSVFSSVSNVNSAAVPALVCPVARITVQSSTTNDTNFSLGTNGTQSVTANVYDTKGIYISPTLTWSSSQPVAATVTGNLAGNNSAVITGAQTGTTSITATCSNPDCNKGLPPAYSYNVMTANVGGTTGTSVYAASTQSLTVVPITTAANTAGTAVTLPVLPTSILPSPSGVKVYLGVKSGGILAYDVVSNGVTALSVNGKALAMSSDSQYLLVADDVNNATYLLNAPNNTVLQTQPGVATAAAFTPDGKWALYYIGQQLFRMGLSTPTNITALGYTPGGIGVLAQGSLLFLGNSGGHAVDVRSTCDQSELQNLTGANPTLAVGLPTGLGAVLADSPAIDIVTTPQIGGSCPVAVQNTLNSYDLGVGSFTAHQMFVSADSSKAWILSNLPEIIGIDLRSLTPFTIPLINGAVPTTGGITLDNKTIYVGGSDSNIHRIDTASGTDAQIIVVGLLNSSGVTVPPDLVAVAP